MIELRYCPGCEKGTEHNVYPNRKARCKICGHVRELPRYECNNDVKGGKLE